LRILFCYWGKKGGGAKYSEELVKAFQELPGCSVFVSFSRRSEVFENIRRLGLEGCHLDTFEGPAGFFIRTFLVPVHIFRLIRFARKRGIRLSYTTMGHVWTPLVVPFLRLFGIRHVMTIHDALPHPGDPGIFVRANRLATRFSDRVVVLSGHVKDFLVEKEGIPESRIIPSVHGLLHYRGLDRRPKVFRGAPFRLIFFGRIEAYKGLGTLLAAFARLSAAHEDISLEVYGSGDLSRYAGMIRGLRNLKIRNRWIREDEIGRIFAKACVNVAPYVEASQSGTIPIALSCGIPTVCTKVGGLSEQVVDGRTGLLVDRKDAEAGLVKAIECLYRDRVLCEALSRNCVKYAREHLSWPRIARSLRENLAPLVFPPDSL